MAETDFALLPHEAALAAADTALADLWRHADANRGPDGSINVSTYAMAKAVIAAVAAIIRADERAKVTEEIAKAIEAQWDNYEPEWTGALRHLAAIARQHA